MENETKEKGNGEGGRRDTRTNYIAWLTFAETEKCHDDDIGWRILKASLNDTKCYQLK